MSLKEFQKKIGAVPDDVFGKETMVKTASYYKLSKEQVSHFFAQVSHETGGFSLFTENLNYSADGLIKIFKKYFPTRILANGYARQPEKIANRVYANRMGNGPETSGDGYKYRGRGALQLTGKSNYVSFSRYVENPNIVSSPDLVATMYAFESALYFFEKNKLWSLCNYVSDDSVLALTKRINGGTNGLSHRLELTKKYYAIINK
jgi:putative chitinase